MNIHPIVNQLRALRTELNVSITALAKKSGYDRTTISRWEHGKLAPNIHALADLCGALGAQLKIEPRDGR